MLFDFFYIVSELKRVPRSGWKNKVGIERPESVADHSFGTAIMSMVLSDSHDLDTEKIMRMALLHDLAESITGDFMPDEISKETKRKAEDDAMSEIFSKLPRDIAKKYELLWEEYVRSETKESMLLHEIDKLDMAIQAVKYASEGFSSEKLDTFIKSARNEIKSKELLEILDTISYK